MLVKRVSTIRSNDLNTVYRPCRTEEIVGNKKNKELLKNYLDNYTLPHTLLFSGPAGCGKTTVARILALSLNCDTTDTSTSQPCLECISCTSILGGSSLDINEINVGKDGGKDAVNKVVSDLAAAPFSSKYKVLIFDESHKLTDAAKDLLLKEMEDGYQHVYFVFCTNQPEALKSKKKGGDAFLSRCSKMRFEALSFSEVKEMLINVAQFEGEEYNEDVINYISEETKGVPRDALTILNDVINEASWDKEAVKSFMGILVDEEDPAIIELSRTLISGRFKDSVKIFETLTKKLQTESIRIATCAYFAACLKRAKSIPEGKKFSAVLDVMAEPIYATGKPSEYIFINMMFKTVLLINNK